MQGLCRDEPASFVAGVITVGHGHPLRGLRDGQPTPPAPAHFARARRGHGHDLLRLSRGV
jgi:hypothetical protein